MEITLPSGRKIGDGHAPFIVAEVGSNWRTLDDCLMSIRASKACGADAVKFQAFTHEALYGSPMRYDDIGDALLKGVLPLEWLPRLKAEADKVGIEFMCSAFSPELLRAVNPFVNIHKIASAELTHVRLLEAARDSGKPVFLSTGASGQADIAQARVTLAAHPMGPTPVILMYCVAAYPAREVNLALIPVMRSHFGSLVGYSDHSLDARTIPQAAIHHGACVLEKHVTFIEGDTPDSAHSITSGEFERMVLSLRGNPVDRIGFTSEEQPMILRHNRRLIATRDIRPGETLEEGVNFGIYRSLKDDTKALSPFAIAKVHGRTAKGAIAAGDGIGPGDIE